MSGTVILDCQGLSLLVQQKRILTEWLSAAEATDAQVVVSSVTLVEARDPKTPQARFDYAVSRVRIVAPTEEIARQASKLLASARLHGHQHAIDAIVAATAHAAEPPVTVLTSDPGDLKRLCADTVRVISLN